MIGWVVVSVLAAADSVDARNAAAMAAYDRAEAAIQRTADEGKACAGMLGNVRAMRQKGIPPVDPEFVLKPFRECIDEYRKDKERRATWERQARAERDRVESEREEKERKAAAAAKADAALNGAAQEIAKDPKAVQGIVSALLCRDSAGRAGVLAELAKEKKYSRIGGVMNLSRRAELQDELAARDDSIRKLRAALKGIKRPAVACKQPAVAVLSTCLSDDPDDHDEACRTAEFQVLLRVAEMVAP